jgi:hypothetical protein
VAQTTVRRGNVGVAPGADDEEETEDGMDNVVVVGDGSVEANNGDKEEYTGDLIS